ncbi:MAG: hypothetical protein JW994_07660 [Candidatus Omnitrophica bacterium]|nr:hypothetical protein [Candidatus Omnitrophota bacterium]
MIRAIKAGLLKILDNPRLSVGIIALVSLLIFFIAYLQSASITFRVEQWDIYHFYSTLRIDSLHAGDWLKIAFWTPFGDFRLIPLAYLWNFVVFSVLGANMFFHWLLSIALTIINCLLLARFVSILKRTGGLARGLIAGSLFLLLPAKFEISIWTFFTYKLIHTAFILLSLIALEEFLWRREKKYAFTSIVLLFVSCLFYELPLLLGAAFFLRVLFFTPSVGRKNKLYVFALLFIMYASYMLIYHVSASSIPRLYGMSVLKYMTRYYIPGTLKLNWDIFFWDLPLAFYNWLSQGILLANTGLSLNIVQTNSHFIFTVPVGNIVAVSLIAAIWCAMLWCSFTGPFERGNIIYLLLLFLFGSVLVLTGRTLTNGTGYLPALSIYQYFPTMLLAAILGYLMDDVLVKGRLLHVKRILVITLFIFMIVLGYADYNSIKSYMKLNKYTASLIKRAGEAIRENPGKRIYAGDYKLPCAPVHSVKSKEHTYHALHLLYGDVIVPDRK